MCVYRTIRRGARTLTHTKPFPAYLSSITVELMHLLTFDTSLFAVSAESPLLITFLQSLAVLRLCYWYCHFLCAGPAASKTAWSKCCCHLHCWTKPQRDRLTWTTLAMRLIISSLFLQAPLVHTVCVLSSSTAYYRGSSSTHSQS